MKIKDIPERETDTQAEIGHNGRRPSQKDIRERAINQILEGLEDEKEEMHPMPGDQRKD